jgi:hypothetical protein
MHITPLDLDPEHFIRSYELPAGVDAMIPTSSQAGEPGLHWVARGLLAETCLRLLARPVSLHYLEKEHITFVSATVSLASTVLSSNPCDVLVAVNLLLNRDTGHWALGFRDRVFATGPHLPAPAQLASWSPSSTTAAGGR